jgi:transcriptional regulator with XRE-family HTH domain
MSVVRNTSVSVPPARDVGRLLFEASRRAAAMGLIGPDAPAVHGPADLGTVRQLAKHVRQAGIASGAAAVLNNVEPPTAEELASLLRTMIAALEASPVPKFEWAGVARVLDAEQLAALLTVSLSSLSRYQSGERETPDAVAARLHFLALVVSDLAGSYNDIGIRRWFGRKRSALAGRTPTQLLSGEWDPDDAGPVRVRDLARELVTLSAT